MANTYSQLFFHLVWSTKERAKCIHHEYQENLYRYIGGILRNEKCNLIEIGGVDDHIHLLINTPLSVHVPKLVGTIKSNSSRWVNLERFNPSRFAWQDGYGGFSVSTSMVPTIIRYIQNQEEHHKKYTFEEEYRELLIKHGVEYDEKYLLG